MDIVTLALFKFKHLEGVLEDWYAHEATSSLYKKGNRRVLVDFDLKNDTVTILDEQGSKSTCKDVPVKELMKTLESRNLVKERTKDRHSSSYNRKET